MPVAHEHVPRTERREDRATRIRWVFPSGARAPILYQFIPERGRVIYGWDDKLYRVTETFWDSGSEVTAIVEPV